MKKNKKKWLEIREKNNKKKFSKEEIKQMEENSLTENGIYFGEDPTEIMECSNCKTTWYLGDSIGCPKCHPESDGIGWNFNRELEPKYKKQIQELKT